MSRLRNILLDRDGTLIRERHYLRRPEEVELLPGAASALHSLILRGYSLFLVSNQSGIGRGYFTEAQHGEVQARLTQLLAQHGVFFRTQLHCPHCPEQDCSCRKPRTGMWDRLRGEFGLLPEETAVVGDKLDDLRLGKRAGLGASILVLTGHGTSQAEGLGLSPPPGQWLEHDAGISRDIPDVIAKDLAAATSWLLNRHG